MSKSKDIIKITATMNKGKCIISRITKGPDKEVSKDDVIEFCDTIISHLKDFKQSMEDYLTD